MIFKTKLHQLPKFPESIRTEFFNQCEPLKDSQLEEFKQAMTLHLAARRAEQPGELIDSTTLAGLVAATRELLSRLSELTSAEVNLAVGAIRYFLQSEDAISDQSFATGLVDDARVMNYVLEELGLEEFYVTYK